MKKSQNMALRSQLGSLPLGTPVLYHHRAGVARHIQAWPSRDYYDSPPRGWVIFDGCYRNEDIPSGMGEGTTDRSFIGPLAEFVVVQKRDNDHQVDITSYRLADMFFNWPQAKFHKYYDPTYPYKPTSYNKTVMVWPAQGEGVVMGMIKKSIGNSSKSSGRGEDFEQGYHDSDMYVDLYVIKERYEGTQYILCPLWAVVALPSVEEVTDG